MRLLDKLLACGEKRFALLVIEGLRRAGESRPIHFEKDRLRLMVGGNAFPLATFYQEYRSASQHVRTTVVRRAVQSWRVEPAPRTAAAVSLERLLPMLLPRAALELLILGAEEDAGLPHHVIGEHLAATIGLGLSGDAKPLSRRELAKAGIEFDVGWNAACENLRRKQSSPWRQIAPSCFACESDDGTAAARMLLPEAIAELRLTSEIVAIPLAPDRLLAAGSDDAAGLAKLADFARSEFQRGPAISGFAFLWSGGSWQPWLPHPDHPAYAALKLLQMETLARDYVQQARFLEELSRIAGEAICLASYSAMQDDRTGKPLSFTVWPEGLEILLPRADEVVFFQPDATGETGRILARLPWPHVERTLGDLLEPLDSYPPRYLVRDFPAPERLAEITSP
jgi:hypothetical protein